MEAVAEPVASDAPKAIVARIAVDLLTIDSYVLTLQGLLKPGLCRYRRVYLRIVRLADVRISCGYTLAC